MRASTTFSFTSRYSHPVATLLDLISFLLYYPWLSLLSKAVSSYLPVFKERQETPLVNYLLWYPIIGPFLLLVALFSSPIGLSGWILSILVSSLFSSSPFSSLTFENKDPYPGRGRKRVFSFATMNIILGVDAIGRFNNIRNVFHRLQKFAEILCKQQDFPLENLTNETQKEESVVSKFPHLDFLCFQEVHDRFFAILLALKLKNQYSHFVFDASRHSFKTNAHLGGSGLMIASRFPILASTFYPFTEKRGWQHAMCYGVLVCKIDLGDGRVGLLSNLHTVAYQGSEPLIDASLSEVHDVVEEFRSVNIDSAEDLVFDVIGGDFNVDNMSPGDLSCAANKLFREYTDPAAVKPGQDKCWAVGTERRQLTVEEAACMDAEGFREILVDDVKRRHYVLDADVEEQTFDLMTVGPRTDCNGEVMREEWGGMRRIDRLLCSKKLLAHPRRCVITGAGFVSALSYLTDHIPVVMTLKIL